MRASSDSVVAYASGASNFRTALRDSPSLLRNFEAAFPGFFKILLIELLHQAIATYLTVWHHRDNRTRRAKTIQSRLRGLFQVLLTGGSEIYKKTAR